MSLQVIFSIVSFISIAILGLFVDQFLYRFQELSYETIILTAAISGVYVCNDFVRRTGFSKQKSSLVIQMDLLGYGLQPLLLTWCFYANSLNLNTSLGVLLFTYSISTLYGGVQLNCAPQFTGIRSVLNEIWNYSRFLIGTSLLQWLSGNFYLITAAGVLGPVALGAIRIAQNIMGVMHVLLQTLENLVPLQAATTFNDKGANAAVQYVFKMFLQAGLPFVGLLISIAIFRTELLGFIYGNSYANYAFVLLAFCAIYVLIFVGTQLRFLIRTFEKNNLIFWSYVLTSILGLSTAKLFVEHFQIYGVLLGIALTQVIMVAFYLFSLKTELKWLVK